MKIGDLVKSACPDEGLVGYIIDIQRGRQSSDGLREIKVEWFNYKHQTWAMKNGIEVINESR